METIKLGRIRPSTIVPQPTCCKYAGFEQQQPNTNCTTTILPTISSTRTTNKPSVNPIWLRFVTKWTDREWDGYPCASDRGRVDSMLSLRRTYNTTQTNIANCYGIIIIMFVSVVTPRGRDIAVAPTTTHNKHYIHVRTYQRERPRGIDDSGDVCRGCSRQHMLFSVCVAMAWRHKEVNRKNRFRIHEKV